MFERVDFRHAENVENDGSRGGPAHGHEDAALPCLSREVVNDEYVVGEPGLANNIQFIIEAVPRLPGRIRVAPGEALPAETGEMLVGGLLWRDSGARKSNHPELELHVAHFGDSPGVIDRVRVVWKEGPHLILGPQVVAGGVTGHLHADLLLHGRVRPDAEKDVLEGRVVRLNIVKVVRRDDRDACLPGQSEESPIQRFVFGDAVRLELDVVILAEQLPVVASRRYGHIEATVE